MWDDKIKIINEDIMDHDFSNYDMVYTFSPFRSPRRLLDFYNKLKTKSQHKARLNYLLLKYNRILLVDLTNVNSFQIQNCKKMFKKNNLK